MQNLSSKLGPLIFSLWTLCILSFTFEIQVQAHLVQLLLLNYQLFLMTKPQTSWDLSEDLVFNLILSPGIPRRYCGFSSRPPQ